MAFEPTQVLVGAALGFFGNGFIRWWQYRRDLWLNSVERLCDTIDQLSSAAVTYWLTEPIRRGETDKKEESAYNKNEILMLGAQTYMDGLLANMVVELSLRDQQILQTQCSVFADAALGGSFGSASRFSDYNRARAIQTIASETTLQIRQAAERAMTVSGHFSSLNQKRKIKQIKAGANIADQRYESR